MRGGGGEKGEGMEDKSEINQAPRLEDVRGTRRKDNEVEGSFFEQELVPFPTRYPSLRRTILILTFSPSRLGFHFSFALVTLIPRLISIDRSAGRTGE